MTNGLLVVVLVGTAVVACQGRPASEPAICTNQAFNEPEAQEVAYFPETVNFASNEEVNEALRGYLQATLAAMRLPSLHSQSREGWEYYRFTFLPAFANIRVITLVSDGHHACGTYVEHHGLQKDPAAQSAFVPGPLVDQAAFEIDRDHLVAVKHALETSTLLDGTCPRRIAERATDEPVVLVELTNDIGHKAVLAMCPMTTAERSALSEVLRLSPSKDLTQDDAYLCHQDSESLK